MILDACVVIALLDAHDTHHDAAVDLLTRSEPLRIHPLNLAEALVAPARTGHLDDVVSALRRMDVAETPFGEAASLAQLRAETGLRLPDCCVLLAAAVADDDTIATFDHRLAAVAHMRDITVVPQMV